MSRAVKNIKRPQTIKLPDGTTVRRRVRDVVDYDGFYLGKAKINNKYYQVKKMTWHSVWNDEFHDIPWEANEEYATDARPRANRTIDDGARAWLDKALTWITSDAYGVKSRTRSTRWGTADKYTPDFTPREVERYLFDNYAVWAVEREVGEDTPDEIRPWFNGSDTKRRYAAVQKSLARLVKAGALQRVYTQRRGRETRAFMVNDG